MQTQEAKREYRHQYYLNHQTESRAQCRMWIATHKQQYQKWCKKYQREHPEVNRKATAKYYQNHKQDSLLYHRIYRSRYQYQLSYQTKKWRMKNQERMKKLKITWMKHHPEAVRAWLHRRRAILLKIPGRFNQQDIQKIYQNQCGLCYYCSTSLNNKYTIDHKIPLVHAGATNWPNNLCLACSHCNKSKGTKTEQEFKEYKERMNVARTSLY